MWNRVHNKCAKVQESPEDPCHGRRYSLSLSCLLHLKNCIAHAVLCLPFFFSGWLSETEPPITMITEFCRLNNLVLHHCRFPWLVLCSHCWVLSCFSFHLGSNKAQDSFRLGHRAIKLNDKQCCLLEKCKRSSWLQFETICLLNLWSWDSHILLNPEWSVFYEICLKSYNLERKSPFCILTFVLLCWPPWILYDWLITIT